MFKKLKHIKHILIDVLFRKLEHKLQFTTARLITNYNNLTIKLGYYNLRRLLLQFMTGITIHEIIRIHDRIGVTF